MNAEQRFAKEQRIIALQAELDGLRQELETDTIQAIVREGSSYSRTHLHGLPPNSTVTLGPGWVNGQPLGPPAGVALADKLMDAQDLRDRKKREAEER